MDFNNVFNPESVKQKIIEWIRSWFSENGDNCNAVVGISGGKDSSVVAALCVEALGNDRVIGVCLPNGVQKDIDDAYRVIEALGIREFEVNISGAVNDILEQLAHDVDAVSDQTMINFPARIRMAALYAVSQSVNGRVANTCNLSEEYVGYSTRWGDSVGDFAPLANLTTDEIVQIGMLCDLPEDLVKKEPSDGLCGKTDEENLGFSYRDLNTYIREGAGSVDAKVCRKIESLHTKNLFKMTTEIPAFRLTD